MKVTAERLENCQIELTVELDEERVEQALRRVAQRVSKQRHIRGFRPGRAPYDVVLRLFGRRALLGEALEDLAQAAFNEAKEKEGIEPFAPPELVDFQDKPVVLKFTVPVAPVVELGDYRQLRLTPPEVKVSEEKVEAVLKRIQLQHSQWQPVERPAQLGDQALVDIESTVEGEVVLNTQEQTLLLEAESPYPLPGFSEQLVGMTIGQDREFDLTYPENAANKKLAGKTGHFKVHLHDLKELVLPELNDDLAKTVGDFDTFDELKAKVYENLLTEAEQKAESRFAAEVLATLVERARIEFPSVLLEQELDNLLEEEERALRRQGRLSLDDWLKINKKSKEGYRDELRPRAIERLKRGLVLGKVVELEGITVEDAEIKARIERLSSSFGEQADKALEVFSSPDQRRTIALDLLTEKALRRLVAIAKGEVQDEAPRPEEAQASETPEVTTPPDLPQEPHKPIQPAGEGAMTSELESDPAEFCRVAGKE